MLLKQHCTPEKACDFIFSTETPSKNMTFLKDCKSKSYLDQNLCQFLFFSLSHNLRQTINIGANFFCNSLLHRNKRLFISAQTFSQSS